MPATPGASCDVVVLGGGPAGSAAAVTLARAGRSVLIVDPATSGRDFRVGEGAPPGLDRTVDEIFGAGTFIADDHQPSYGNRAAWGSARVLDTDFMFNPLGHGWHLDRVAFDARLLAIAEAAGATVGRRFVDAAVVIDASGRRAAFARGHGGRLVTHDRLAAAVAVYPCAAEDRDRLTTVESVETGWWYAAAIPGRRRVVAFLTDGDLLPSALRSSAGFDRDVRATDLVAGLLGDGRPTRPRVVAAATAHLDRPVGDGWLAAGDAAACFDPLSSQGILTAVLMGRAAAEAAVAGRAGSAAYEARYRAVVEQFRAEQRATYALEQRWPDSPFWSRRHLEFLSVFRGHR
ncbi:MAG: tryptophan 7-halogenase [Ilumatobacteraceae bacterium]